MSKLFINQVLVVEDDRSRRETKAGRLQRAPLQLLREERSGIRTRWICITLIVDVLLWLWALA